MAASLKRRRMSPDTYVPVNDNNHYDQVSVNTPTPKRLSYHSPTKSSLARSNPQLLQNSASAKILRESEPNRRQSLRDAVLGNKSLLPTDYQQDVSKSRNTTSSESASTTPAVDAQREFANPLPSIEKDLEIPNTPHRHNPDRQPFSRQSNQSSTPRRNTQLNRYASPKIVPQLVDSPRTSSRRSESTEIDLPPTPVQLGKDRLPDRPRGLSSSSPGGRDKRRTRIRGGDGSIYSSPLKRREMAPLLSEDEDDIEDDAEIASGLGDDDRENTAMANSVADAMDVSVADPHAGERLAASDVHSAQGTDLTNVHSDMIEKENKFKALQAQLESLQEDLKQVEAVSTRLYKSRTHDLEALKADFDLILANIDQNEPVSALPTDKDPLFEKHHSGYLTLFAPPELTMSYDTWGKTISGHQKFVYQTTFAASNLWPADTFILTLETLTDWNTNVVEDVVLGHDIKQPEIGKWMKARLQDPILKHDPATLVTGAGRFFEASVKRAKVWKVLTEVPFKDGSDEQEHRSTEPDHTIASQKEAHSLVPFMFKTQHAFAPPSLAQSKTRRSLGSAKQLMLTYDISLDWTGQPTTKTEILMTGFSHEIVEAAKQLYVEVESVKGIVEALIGVQSILGMGDNGTENGTGLDKGKMRTKKGKARRMTVFE